MVGIQCVATFYTIDAEQVLSASEMTYIVSSGALNSTHLLTYAEQVLVPRY